MTEVANPRIQARLPDDLAAWLDSRAERMRVGSSNKQAVADLDMWRATLHLELRRIRLTLPQAQCIADVCNGWLLDVVLGGSVPLVYAECHDAFRIARDVAPGLDPDISSYGAKWGQGADPRAWEDDLLARLQSLGPAADHALRDAINRWWRDGLAGTVEGFARVGLRVTEISEEQQS